MTNFYKIFICFFLTAFSYAQQAPLNIYVDKAWVYDSEEWNTFKYQGQIVVSTTPIEGNFRISNYDFLYGFCNGQAKFTDKATYGSASFESKRKVSAKKDKQGILNSTYEGILVFQSGSDYYSTFATITILEKGYVVGMKIKEKNKSKEYAFSFKPNS